MNREYIRKRRLEQKNEIEIQQNDGLTLRNVHSDDNEGTSFLDLQTVNLRNKGRESSG